MLAKSWSLLFNQIIIELLVCRIWEYYYDVIRFSIVSSTQPFEFWSSFLSFIIMTCWSWTRGWAFILTIIFFNFLYVFSQNIQYIYIYNVTIKSNSSGPHIMLCIIIAQWEVFALKIVSCVRHLANFIFEGPFQQIKEEKNKLVISKKSLSLIST